MSQVLASLPGIDDKLIRLREVFGFDGFRDGQEEVVAAILANQHSFTVMPTGAGKSLCYQLPALLKPGLTIVVSPLVALMQDQVAALQLVGVAAVAINSAQSRDENVEHWHKVRSGEVKLLYMAPERLMSERMIAALQRLDIALIVIDEAHCISQWGPAFRPEYEMLAGLRQYFPNVPLAAFTASADSVTRDDIIARLFDGDALSFIHGFDRPNIRLVVNAKNKWKEQLVAFMRERGDESGIIYCLSRKKTEEVAGILANRGVKALVYHAGLSKEARQIAQDRFMSEPGMVMVATIAFGMGIDKPDIRFVLHTDMPGSPEAYYQEIGRAGRDGEAAIAHMLFGLDDLRMRRQFIVQEGGSEERQRRENKRLDALVAYCEAPSCRRVALLNYFGETSHPCGNCDICLDPVELADGTSEAQKVLAVVQDTGNRFGAAHIVDVLRGMGGEKVVKFDHDKEPSFGVGADMSAKFWRGFMRQIVAAGLLDIDIAGYGGLKITPKGLDVLSGQGDFHYRPQAITTGKDRASGKTKATKTTNAGHELSNAEQSLLQRLKTLRLSLAQEKHVPAYIIFTDRSLIDMSKRQPASKAEFNEVHGVGIAKLKAFSALFLAEIAEWQQENAQ